eukprot:scaffold381_cov168-Ochromonas_danica.AAC.8
MEDMLSQPQRYTDLGIILACQVIRAGLEKVGKITSQEKLCLYIAIDEYQAIPYGSDGESKLQQLANLLVDASLELPSSNIFLFPIFAGVEWGKIPAFSSSNTLLAKVTPSLLSLPGSLKIASALFPEGFCSRVFLDCLTELGDHPRLAVRFTMDACSLDRASADSLLALRSEILTNHGIGSHRGLSTVDLMRLIAVAVVGLKISPESPSGIQDLTWEQLANRGLVQISSAQFLDISYALLFTFCIGMEPELVSDPTAKLFWKILEYIVVKLPSLPIEAWEKWERFGAYYHALRMNAFILLGRHCVTIGELLGPSARASEEVLTVEVCLRPAEVFFSQDVLSPDVDLSSIGQRNNIYYKVSAFDPKNCFVFCNGTNGAGVDIFFALERTHGGRHVLIVDQRKLDCQPLTKISLEKLSNKAKLVYPQDENITYVISVLCSALADFGKKKVAMPCCTNVAMGRKELLTYHGPLSRCVATFARMNINLANQTWLCKNVFNNDIKHAREFIARRKDTKITFSKLSEFVKVFSEITSSNSFPQDLRDLLLLDDDLELQTTGEGKDEDEDEDEDEDDFDVNDEQNA